MQAAFQEYKRNIVFPSFILKQKGNLTKRKTGTLQPSNHGALGSI